MEKCAKKYEQSVKKFAQNSFCYTFATLKKTTY